MTRVWIGHMLLTTGDVARASAFYSQLGLRPKQPVRDGDDFAELVMAGGSDLILLHDPAVGADATKLQAPFDLMTDDLDALHTQLRDAGLRVTDITEHGHRLFTLRDPDGRVVTVNDPADHVAR